MLRMIVKRVGDEFSTRIEPPLNPKWDKLTQLRWHAAVVHADTDIWVDVKPADYRIGGIPVRNHYNLSTPGAGACGPLTFASAWTFLNGVDFGVRAAGRERERRAHHSWYVDHPGIGEVEYPSREEAHEHAGTAGTVYRRWLVDVADTADCCPDTPEAGHG